VCSSTDESRETAYASAGQPSTVSVYPRRITSLSGRVAEFRRVYEPDVLAVADFDGYGTAVREL